MSALAERIVVLEASVLALARAEFGDQPGHPFHGNQYHGGSGGDHNNWQRNKRAKAAEQNRKRKETKRHSRVHDAMHDDAALRTLIRRS